MTEQEKIGDEHPFAPYVRILGRGKRARRDMTRQEACEAFSMILAGDVTDAQLGAWLLLLRVKEETPDELAGMIAACRKWLAEHRALPAVDLDWPSYAGKKKYAPWYLLAALALACQGVRILMHGGTEHTAGRLYSEQALKQMGISPATSMDEAGAQLDAHNFSYVPLRSLCPPLDGLLGMRYELGVRSPINTLARCINPAQAPSTMQSVFHPSYSSLQKEAASLLGDRRLLLFKGEGGEIEIRPDATTRLFGLRDEAGLDISWPASLPRQQPTGDIGVQPLLDLWRGTSNDIYGEQAVVQTMAVALFAMGRTDSTAESIGLATRYWDSRDRLMLPEAPLH